jgi:hypothetical protein
MKNDDMYERWRQLHRQVTTSPDFSARVMDRIAHDAAGSRSRRSSPIEWISTAPWAQAATVAVATLVGVARILLTLHVLLFA